MRRSATTDDSPGFVLFVLADYLNVVSKLFLARRTSLFYYGIENCD